MPEDALLIVGITLACMVSPGPDMVLVMRNTVLGGRRAGFETSAGVLAGNLVHITYCALGLGWVIARDITVYSWVRYLGAGYLIFLGTQSLRGARRAAEGSGSAGVEAQRIPFAQGILNNLLNPKGALFYLGVFTQLITPATTRVHAAVMIAAMVGTSALFWVLFVFTLERRWVSALLTRFRQALERLFGAVLIALGVRVALRD